VVRTAVKLVIEPIFEADLEPNTYGYRPNQSAADAIKQVKNLNLLWGGQTDVVDADLSKYFDTIPHGEMMQCVARRIVDRMILSLIKMWLKAPVEERDRDGTRRVTGGKGNTRGTPQGGVISPLLANLYLNRLLKFWRMQERTKAYRAHIVSYADDFVILSVEEAPTDAGLPRLPAVSFQRAVPITSADQDGCICRLLPVPCCLPPAQASHALRPAGSLSRPGRPLSRGFDGAGYPPSPLVSYQINRQLSGWSLPPLTLRAFGAHCLFPCSGGRGLS